MSERTLIQQQRTTVQSINAAVAEAVRAEADSKSLLQEMETKAKQALESARQESAKLEKVEKISSEVDGLVRAGGWQSIMSSAQANATPLPQGRDPVSAMRDAVSQAEGDAKKFKDFMS